MNGGARREPESGRSSASALVFTGGLLASLLYRLSGSLGAPMLFHALFNLYAFGGTWFALEVPYW